MGAKGTDIRRVHLCVNEQTDTIVRSESKKSGVTIEDYVASTALSFHADEISQKLDTTLKKLKRYMRKRGIKYKKRRRQNGKRKR